MRILVLDDADRSQQALARDLAAGLALPVVDLERGNTGPTPPEACVLLARPETAAEAATLEARLEGAGRAPDLVLSRAGGDPVLARRLANHDPADAPPAAHFGARGRLRRLRPEGGTAAMLAAARRMVEDLRHSLDGESDDAFAALLRRSAGADPGAQADAAPATAELETGSAPAGSPPPGGWKESAVRKGRLLRHPTGSRPAGGNPRRGGRRFRP